MNPEGLIGESDLAKLMVELWVDHFTGALRLEDDSIIKIIYFRDGDLVSASTNDSGDSIGEILLRGEKLTRDHLKGAMNKRKEDESIADTLLALGFISKKELSWARRAQLAGVIRAVLGWSSGNYAIVSDYLPRRQEGTSFPFAQVLLEVFLTETERARFDAAFPGGSTVLRRGNGFVARYESLGLNDEADEISELIDGSRSVGEIAAASTADSFNVIKLLYSLEILGLLERDEEEAHVVPEVFASPVEPAAAPLLEWDVAELEVTPADQPVTEEERWQSTDDEGFLRPKRRSRVPMFLLVVLVLMVAAIAVFAFRGMFGRDLPPIEPRPAASPSQPVPTTGMGVNPVLEDTTTATVGELIEIPAVVPVPTPTATAESSTDAEVPAPDPAPGEPVPSPTATPDAVRARYDEMAAAFQARMGEKPFAIQFAILCQTSSVTNALKIDASNVWFVPMQFGDRPCYRAFYGRYDSQEAAEAALLSMPDALRQGSAPAVVRTQ